MKLQVFVFLLGLFCLANSAGYYCPHDKLNLTVSYDYSVTKTSTFHYTWGKSSRSLQSSAYQSIRIYPDYTYLQSEVDSQLFNYVKNDLLPAAINYYTQTLSIVRLTKNLTSSFSTICGLTTPTVFTGTGVAADLGIIVDAAYDDNDYLAYARACVLSHVNNRPNFGNVHLNLNYITVGDEMTKQQNLITVLHEMAHVFGISQGLYEYYINPDTGKTLTNHVKQTVVNGVSSYVINVDPLTTKLQDYFACPSIEGALLENEGPEESAASHFERRVFYDEIMTAASIENAKITEFTLAFLEGTGWYKGNYSMVETMYWGKGKGCDFYYGPCVDIATQMATFDEFCSHLTEVGCSPSRRSGASCGSSYVITDSSVVSVFDYWGNDTVVSDMFSDNCPYFDASDVKDCENPYQQKRAKLSAEAYGTGSRCYTGTMGKSNALSAKSTYCLKTACQQNADSSFYMQVTFGSFNVTCTKEGSKSVDGYAGTFDCPDPNAYCQTYGTDFCPRGCMGRGNCVENVCQCDEGWGGADCSVKTFVDGCTKCAGEEWNLACYGDDCECLSTNTTCLCNNGIYYCDENGNVIVDTPDESDEEIEEADSETGGSSNGGSSSGGNNGGNGGSSGTDGGTSTSGGNGSSASLLQIAKPIFSLLLLAIIAV